jgi:xanthosine utilization system XapX-like protein
MERNLVMICTPKSKAERNYLKRLALTQLFYLILLFMTRWTFRHFHPAGPAAYLLALLPALPVVASFGVVGLYIAEQSDEFERSITIQSLLWGLGGALSINTIWGFLEDSANVPHITPIYTYFFFWILMGISQPFIRRRYR